jgi:ABC-type sugar transport system ATPase subunit
VDRRGSPAGASPASPASPGLAIRTVGLTRRFGSLTAVDGLSIEVSAGEVFGLT